jgi:two-component system sensor histidine kinase UhpB
MNNLTLQIRISIILVVFFVLGITTMLVRASLVADDLIMTEVKSIQSLLDSMLNIAELGNDSPFNTEAEPAFLSELVALENIRHIDIRIQSPGIDYPQVNTPSRNTINAPAWFIALVYPDEDVLIRSFTQSNGDVISIFADPGDEIEEFWIQIQGRIIATIMYLILMLVIVFAGIQHWMRQLNSIMEVLDNVEAGDFSRRIPSFSLPELNKVGDRINRLTASLGAHKSENERLTRKSIVVQEKERRHLAQELHDSMGQSVSAIKAIAVSIADRSKESDTVSSNSAKNIEEIADSTYTSVRNMMTSLRPSVLDELGLNKALRQMTDDWNVHHEDTFCRLALEDDYATLHEDQQINLYIIIQEALTNITKYANAESVSINISGNEIVTLLIVDDGIGFEEKEVTKNMGLTGIRDRVTLLQGDMQIDSKPGHGVSIQIEFPRVNLFRRRASDGR